MTRTQAKVDGLRRAGAEPAVVDALDAEAVGRAVGEAEPDVIVHQLTAIPAALDMRHFARDFAPTNRLRTEGTDHLLSAGRAAGVKRFVAQSNAGWYAREGVPVKHESDPLDETPPRGTEGALAALRHVEAATTDATWTDGLVLRYGWFYGPGTSVSLSPVGTVVDALRTRKFPIVGSGTGVWSFIHIEDAATATLAAIEGGDAGIYNVVDDEPARVATFLPALAAAVGAKPPRRVPRWLARMAAGEFVVTSMTAMRGAANAKAKRELGWRLRYPSWRQGFAEGLG